MRVRVAIGGIVVAVCASLAACASPPEISVRPLEPDDTLTPAPSDPSTTAAPTTDTEPAGTTPTTGVGAETADDVGDPLTPGAGNPGFDIEHYDLDLTYDPAADLLDGLVTIRAVATDDLEQLTLDLIGIDVAAVAVDGEAAEHEQDDPELRIVPSTPIESGGTFEVSVTYGGATEDREDGPFSDIDLGWIDTDIGSHVLNQPDGARQWFPSSDHPSDKATFDFRITVPEGYTVVTNGRAAGTQATAEGVMWRFVNPEPMATYLVQIAIGRLDVVEREVGSLDHRSAVPEGTVAGMTPYLDLADEVIPFFEPYFGPYPFDRYGLLITDSAPGLALETQTLPIFSSSDLPPLTAGATPEPIAQLLIAHELAHMWFGDAVSPLRWSDLWLNEGFATYAQWMWLDHIGLFPLEEEAELARQQMPDLRASFGATDDPQAATLFSPTVYEGGAVVLHALRRELGDEAFFALLQDWVADNAGTSVSTADFVAAASEAAGRDLDGFLATWLGEGELPEYPDPT
jgi:aminopeptidase N